MDEKKEAAKKDLVHKQMPDSGADVPNDVSFSSSSSATDDYYVPSDGEQEIRGRTPS